MNGSESSVRLLAVDPSTRGFGYVVVEGKRRLVDWGLARVGRQKNADSLRRLAIMVRVYEPRVLVTEDCASRTCQRRQRIRLLIAGMVRYAQAAKLDVRLLSWPTVRERLDLDPRANKEAIAAAVARIFPTIADRIPPHRKAWMSERSGMSLFDAAAFAAAAQREI